MQWGEVIKKVREENPEVPGRTDDQPEDHPEIPQVHLPKHDIQEGPEASQDAEAPQERNRGIDKKGEKGAEESREACRKKPLGVRSRWGPFSELEDVPEVARLDGNALVLEEPLDHRQ